MTKTKCATRTVFFLSILTAAGLSPAMTLTSEQRVKVLAEAQSALNDASRLEATQPAAAREAYAQAAEKFQLLAEKADCGGELYRRLAEAQLRSGRIGKAIANYQRAEQLLGPDPRVVVGLATARHLRDGDESALVVPATTLPERLSLWNRSLSLSWRFRGALAVWVILWSALGISLFLQPRAFRISAGVCGLVFVLLAASLAWDLLPDWNRTRGVVTAPTAVLRQGNSQSCPPCVAPLKNGAEFNLIERRGRWLRISLPDGNTGWLDDAQADLLPPRHTLWS
jgi:hypothetical protein